MNKDLFLDLIHEERFKACIQKDMTFSSDIERKAMFYILTGCEDLWNKGIEKIYDFDEHSIHSRRKLSSLSLCSSSQSLIYLALNLYNGFAKSNSMDPYNLFYSLDKRNTELAINALKIRYRSN